MIQIMSTILTINTKDPETRVTFGQPLRSISEIQLVDYDFPDIYATFGKVQTIKKFDGSSTSLSLSEGDYSLKMLIAAINYNNSGAEIQPSLEGYNLITKNEDITFSEEFSEKLGLPTKSLPAKKFYPISWPSHKYHVYCNISASSSMLGQITTTTGEVLKLAPTNLLAIIPSKSGRYPSIPIQAENHPINYLTLSLLDENGNKPNFSGVPFRISLRVLY